MEEEKPKVPDVIFEEQPKPLETKPIKKTTGDFKLNIRDSQLVDDSNVSIDKSNMKKGSGNRSIGSSLQSSNDDNESIIAEEDKTIAMRLNDRLKEFQRNERVRSLKRRLASYFIRVLIDFCFFLSFSMALLIFTFVVPGKQLSNISIFNLLHIVTSFSGHLFYRCCDTLLRTIHKGILAAKVSHHGCNIREMTGSSLSASLDGYGIRQLVFGLSAIVGVLLSFFPLSYNWVPTDSDFVTGQCILASYPEFHSIYPNLGDFMQGDVDIALAYTFGIPLEDGLVGGWSSWPMENPFSSFSMNGPGYVYALNINCQDTYPSFNFTSEETYIWLTESFVQGNKIQARIKGYYPNASIQTTTDIGLGVYQECSFVMAFGKGNVQFSFISDEWDMVALNQIQKITVGDDVSVTQRDSKNRYSTEFSKNLVGLFSFKYLL